MSHEGGQGEGAWRTEQVPAGGPIPRRLTALTSEGGRHRASEVGFSPRASKSRPLPTHTPREYVRKTMDNESTLHRVFHLRYHSLATYFVETKNGGPLVPKAA